MVAFQERQWKNFLESYCSENIYVLPMYWHVLISVIVWFPMGVMVICYSAIFLKLDRYEQKVLRRENPISVSYKTKVAKMMFTVLIVFVLLRVPFTTLIFIRNQMLKDTKVNQVQGAFSILWYCSHYLMFCNAAINPIIYGLTNDNFRKAYRQTPLIKLFCKSTGGGLGATTQAGGGGGGKGHSMASERKQRVRNMLLSQDQSQGGNKERASSPETSTSNIWHTKKSTVGEQVVVKNNNPRVITTNLVDSATDPLDYEIMENEESQVAERPREEGKELPSQENFI